MPEIIRSIGELIRSIPAIVGFYPSNSLVLILHAPSQPMCVRTDLVPQALNQIWRPILNRHKNEGVTGLVAVVVADDMPRHRGMIDQLADRAKAEGIPLLAAAWTSVIAKGSVWRLYDRELGGVLDEPASALATTVSAYEGLAVMPSREALAATLLPTAPADVLARRHDLATVKLSSCYGPFAKRIVTHAMRLAAKGSHPSSDEEFAGLVAALHDVYGRDAAYGWMVDAPVCSAALWHHVLRNVDQRDQGYPAIMLSIASALDANGPLASVAIELACARMPQAELPNLVHTALVSGITPKELHALLTDSLASAHSG